MNEEEALSAYYGRQNYIQQLQTELATARLVEAYCSTGKAYAETGLQDIALNP